MKWTTSIKGITTLFLVLMIIGVLVYGFSVMDVSPTLGVVIMCVGTLLSILSVGLIMVLCEISENLYYIRSNMGKGSGILSAASELKRQRDTVSDGSWVCNCGTRNMSTSRFCKSCGKEKSTLSAPVSAPNKSSIWICPECGKSNPNSCRVCKDCGYNK